MKVWKEIVSLPFFPDLTIKKVDYIIKCLVSFDKKHLKYENL
jgi:dTDP-4-amino-4,6-dideoxygalactose transaminase